MSRCFYSALFAREGQPLPDILSNGTRISGWDYILFTNLDIQSDYWTIRKIDMPASNPVLSAKSIKWLSHKYLSEYEIVFWLDAYISFDPSKEFLLQSYLVNLQRYTIPMLITKHPARSCVYDECNKVLEYKRDTIDHVNTVREYLHSISMPHNYGLYETKCILKLNKNESVINICTNVMNLLLTHSQRDQLLLTPVLFFHNKSHLEYLEPMYITSGKYVNHRLDTPNIRVAVCFWGITRSLKYTHSSIKRYIFSPLTDANIEYDIYLHTYSVDAPYSNLRANEINIKLDNEEYKILNSDYTCVESQDEIDRTLEFEKYRTCGDPWPDSCEFKTLDNHIRALWSLHKVTDMWYENRKKYTHIIYCRPDVEYTKPINTKWFECDINNTIIIPNFQLADDVNDRFAIGTPDTMYVYGNRFTTAYEYSKSNTLHSEDRKSVV